MKKNKITLVVILSFLSAVSFGQAKKWTLEECVNHALQNNISIKQSAFDKELAEINKKDAIGRFLPNVGGVVSHGWNFGLSNDPLTGIKKNQTTESSFGSLSVGVDLYKGLQNQNQLRKANLSKIAAQYQLTKMQEDVSLNVVNAYLQILFNKENLKVQNEQFVFDTKQMERTTELVDAGTLPKGDLLDIKATLATDSQRIVAAENALLISKISLAQLLQLKEYEEFDIADSEIEPKASTVLLESPKAIFTKAKETRAELKLAQTNMEIAKKDIAIARGAYQPSLTASYGIQTSVLHKNTLIPSELIPSFSNQIGDNKGQNIGMQLTIPIFNGFATRNNVFRSKVALEKSKLTLEQQETELERTIYTAFTDTKGAQKSFEAANTTLQARQNAMNYAKERYEVGMRILKDKYLVLGNEKLRCKMLPFGRKKEK